MMGEVGAQRFADQLLSAAQHFAQTVQCRDMQFQVGRQVISFVVPKSEVPVCNALERTLVPARHREPDATVYLVDERCGAVRPDQFWSPSALQKNGVIKHSDAPHIDIAFENSSKSLNVLDRRRGVGVLLLSSIASYLPWALTCPFRLIISWIADMFGGDLLHAAVVESSGVGVAVVGRSGSGKSTLSVAAASRGGWRLLSDDFILWSDEKRAFSVFTTVKLTQSTAQLLQLEHVARSHDVVHSKFVIPGGALPNVTTIAEAPISAVVMPTFGTSPEVAVASPNALLPELVLHSLAGTLGGGPRSLSRMKEFLSNKVCYEVTLVEDTRTNVATLDDLVRAIRNSG